MNEITKNIVEILKELKTKYNAKSLKIEFEKEGTRLEEAINLKKIATLAGLDFTVKIGGCEAIRDLYDAKQIGAKSIIAPMIESNYALQKFILALKRVFTKTEMSQMDFFINLETILGYENIDKIITSEYFSDLSGIVLGRSDLAESMEISKSEINSDKILCITNAIGEKISNLNKKFIVGGKISSKSINFFQNVSKGILTGFETRKIVFEIESDINSYYKKGILKALEFELLWLKNKEKFGGYIDNEDLQRIKAIQMEYDSELQRV